MDFRRVFILVLSVLFFSPSCSTAMNKINSTGETFKKDKPNPNDECIICLEDYSTNKDYLKLTCQHFVHCQCIFDWRKSGQHYCPVCKAEFTRCDLCSGLFYLGEENPGKKKVKLTDCKNNHYYHFDCLRQANSNKNEIIAYAITLCNNQLLHPCPKCRSELKYCSELKYRSERIENPFGKYINSNKNVNSYDYDDDDYDDYGV